MEDNEIIKALECCDCPTLAGCDECYFKSTDDCTGNLTKATVDFINRQKADIDRQREYIELLDIEHEAIRNKAIKEFAERLKEKERPVFPLAMVIDVYEIDNLVKEMVGEG